MESLKYHFNSSYLEKRRAIPTKKKLEIGVCSNLIKFREHRVPDKSNPKRFIQRHMIKMKNKKMKIKRESLEQQGKTTSYVQRSSHKAVLCCAKSVQSRPALCDRMDCSLPGSSVQGILQARILEWVAISFSRGSSRPRDLTQVLLHQHWQILWLRR